MRGWKGWISSMNSSAARIITQGYDRLPGFSSIVGHQIPAVITGTKFDGIDLPYVDMDNEAICRHAVGLLIARNRKSICFQTATHPQPGDLLSETGFTQGIHASQDVRGRIARCHLTQRAIRKRFRASLDWEPVDRPPLVLSYPLPESSLFLPFPHREAARDTYQDYASN